METAATTTTRCRKPEVAALPRIEILPSLPRLAKQDELSSGVVPGIRRVKLSNRPSQQPGKDPPPRIQLFKAYSTLDKLTSNTVIENKKEDKTTYRLDKSISFIKNNKSDKESLSDLHECLVNLTRSYSILCKGSNNTKSESSTSFYQAERPTQLEAERRSIVIRNVKYDLIDNLAMNGHFSEKTTLVSNSNTGSYFVVKKLAIFEGYKKETVTKIYETLGRLGELRLNRNVNKVMDIYLSNDLKFFFILQEHCALSLAKCVSDLRDREDRVSPVMAFKWFEQAMIGLKFLHETCSLLHGNLKPVNILLDSSMTHLKLSDFGYINIYNKFKYLLKLVESVDNKSYLPMETIKSYKYTSKSDIYSLGCIFYEVMYVEPYNATSNQSQVQSAQTKDELFEHLLQSMLNTNESMRPSSTEIVKLLFWLDSIYFVRKIETKQKGFFSLTHLIKWRYSEQRERFCVFKQINVSAAVKCATITEILPKIVKNKLEHDNLIPISNYLLISNRLLVITDLLGSDFLNLEQKLLGLKGAFSSSFIDQVLISKWLPQIISALDYLHSKSVIHGNLKLENVLVNSNNVIKLIDFGFYHVLTSEGGAKSGDEDEDNDEIMSASLKVPLELTKKSFLPVTHKLDVFMLGLMLFEAMSFNGNVVLLQRHRTENGLIGRLKKVLFKMLSEDPFDRPELKAILFTLNNGPDGLLQSGLLPGEIESSSNMAKITGRVVNFFSREKDFIVIRTFRKRTYKTVIDWQCLKISRTNSELDVETFSFFDTMLLIKKHSQPVNSFQCNCSNLMSKLNENSESSLNLGSCSTTGIANGLTSVSNCWGAYTSSLLFPKCFCQVGNNYLIGANSDLIYLIDPKLRYVKSLCLIETLEMKQNPEADTSHRNVKHTTLINKLDLRLDTVSICYDSFDPARKRVFLLTSVQDQYFFINAFDMEFSLKLNMNINLNQHAFNADSTSNNKPFREVTKFNMLLCGKYYVSQLSAEYLNKKILCNQNFVFICERQLIVRVFSKEDGKYLFSIKNKKTEQSPQQQRLRAKDIAVDSNGHLYIAYDTFINVYDENCEFLWRYEFQKELSSSGTTAYIVQISILSSNGSIGILAEDDKGINKLYIYN